MVIPAERCWLQVVDATLDAAFQSLGVKSQQRLGFAAREALINAMRVAEELDGEGVAEIEIQLTTGGGWTELRVIDPGQGLPEGWQQKLEAQEVKDSVVSLSGRGLMFIKEFVDELSSVRDAEGRHILIMRKREGDGK
ncbi:MAG: ATP-binding protein [Negativicutes bacterium]|nr:ATP-binding protein [Negativicutes bacterium]